MPISFEELADSGLPQAPIRKRKKSISWKALLLLPLLLIFLSAGLGYVLLSEREPVITEAATILLSVDREVAHSRDEATEFKESFVLLKPGIKEPEYRETEDASASKTVLRVEPESIEVRQRDQESGELVAVEPSESANAGLSIPSLDDMREVVQEKLVEEKPVIDGKPVERDWGGVVLVPDGIRLAKAYTSDVRLVRVEAHPIDGERLRVWARVKNVSKSSLSAEIGCEFRSVAAPSGRPHYVPTPIEVGEIVDVYFDSPKDRVESYTVLVKRVI